MSGLYWDKFEQRSKETIHCLQNNTVPPVRRVAIHITNKCNFRCEYCNMKFGKDFLSEERLDRIINKYKKTALFHITGGEPLLVPYLKKYIEKNKNIEFNLNSNLFLKPPTNLNRLKVSMDTHEEDKFNSIVGVRGAYKNVIKNIKEATQNTIVSITYVLNKKTYKKSPEFMRWARKTFPKLYAVFFSCYKGNDKNLLFNKDDIETFFKETKSQLISEMDKESLNLFNETIDEKIRLIQGDRFPENKRGLCYLSMTERVYDWNGKKYNCSHLFRDSINHTDNEKRIECRYGCNRRLVRFNEIVENSLRSNHE